MNHNLLRSKSLTKIVISISLLIFITSLNSTASAQSAVGRQLPDVELFTTNQYAGWAGSGLGLTIELGQYNFLPLDKSVRFNNLPSMHINVSGAQGSGGWWRALLAGPDWESYSIAPYMANGALEFSVKGAKGGETFTVSLNDIQPGREPLNIETVRVPISEFTGITTEWQRVSIPLTRFTDINGEFNSNQMFTVGLGSSNTNPINFWIADIRFTSPDVEPSYPAIKINQNGYRIEGHKQVLVSGFADELAADVGTSFNVRSVNSNEVVYEGTLELMAELDPASGERVLQADFSPLDQPGEYYLSVDAFQVADSGPFVVSETVYAPLVADTMRYFYLQRSGIALDATHAGPFARGVGHLQDSQAQFRSGTYRATDVSGGWYDAGDYGKYTNAGATAVSDLLWTYELFPEQFPDNHLNIPESGNGVSDLLDEVRWELDWMLKMQDPNSGGFYHMVQPTEDFLPDQAQGDRFIEDVQGNRTNVRPTSTSASAVAALAHAAVVFQPIDPDYAAELLAAAEFGFTYFENNPSQVAPLDGPYSDAEDSDNRFWAAGALYRATEDEKYQILFKSLAPTVRTTFESQNDNAYGVNDMGMVGWLAYMFSENQDPEMTELFREKFNGWSAHMNGRWENSTWNHTLLDEDYYWGSNYVALTTPLVLYAGHVALGQDTGTAAAISQQALDYLLGSNPLAISYVSGYGPNSVKNVYSVMWSEDDISDPPAGVLVGGPNAYSNPLFFSNFAGKQYVDGNGFWTLNEHTIYWNSALVFNAAMQANGVSVVLANPIPEPTSTPEPAEVPTEVPDETESGPAVKVELTEVETADSNEPDQSEGVEKVSILVEESTNTTTSDTRTIMLAAIIGSLATVGTLGIGFFIWRIFSKKEL